MYLVESSSGKYCIHTWTLSLTLKGYKIKPILGTYGLMSGKGVLSCDTGPRFLRSYPPTGESYTLLTESATKCTCNKRTNSVKHGLRSQVVFHIFDILYTFEIVSCRHSCKSIFQGNKSMSISEKLEKWNLQVFTIQVHVCLHRVSKVQKKLPFKIFFFAMSDNILLHQTITIIVSDHDRGVRYWERIGHFRAWSVTTENYWLNNV